MEHYDFYDDIEYTWSDEMDTHIDNIDYFPHLSGYTYNEEFIDKEDNNTEEDNMIQDMSDDDSEEDTIIGRHIEYIPVHIEFQKKVVIKPKPKPKIIDPEHLKSYGWKIPEIKPIEFPITRVELTKEIPNIEYKQKYSRVCRYKLQCKKWNCVFAHTIDEFEPVKV